MASVPTSSSANAIQATINAAKGNMTVLYGTTAPPWVDAPEFRGTMSILQTCVTTLVACLYTALHLNVPCGDFVTYHKIKWLLLSVLFPEIAVFCAARQYCMARAFVKKLRELQTLSITANKEFKFDTRYGFFVLLGGAAVSVKDVVPTRSEREELVENDPTTRPSGPWGRTSSTGLESLAPETVLELARLGHFIYFSPETISDRSRSSGIAKALIVAQVLWFVTQCLVRKIYSLPLTLLELHTIVHVVCAIVMYAMWWNKPHDVTTPERIDEKGFEDLVALMVQESWPYRAGNNKSLVIYANSSSALQVKERSERGGDCVYLTRFLNSGTEETVPAIPFDASKSSWLEPGQVLDCGIGLMSQAESIQITPKDMLRFERVMHAIRRLDPAPLPDTQPYAQNFPYRYYRYGKFESAFLEESNNLPDLKTASYEKSDEAANENAIFGVPFRGGTWWWLAVIEGLSLMNTGIHLLAWSFPFPSEVESYLWKISCFIPASVLPLLWLTRSACIHEGACICYGVPVILSFVAATFMCVPSRLFLVIESFISLRSVPIGVYWTPSWLQMIPHV